MFARNGGTTLPATLLPIDIERSKSAKESGQNHVSERTGIWVVAECTNAAGDLGASCTTFISIHRVRN
jgi:hypothetical protein